MQLEITNQEEKIKATKHLAVTVTFHHLLHSFFLPLDAFTAC